jgi:hypothetical protein
VPPLRILIEAGQKRVFACALDYTGLARSGKTEEAAIEALLAALPRYSDVAREAGQSFDAKAAGATMVVVERVEGNATTDFGAPGIVGEVDRRPLTNREAEREAARVAAAWKVLERVAAKAPEALRKGPRGGGRNRTKILEHVAGSDRGYAAAMGLRNTAEDRRSIDAVREEILQVLRQPTDGSPLGGKRWPSRYAARRVAWHALDHAWEIEDRSEPA